MIHRLNLEAGAALAVTLVQPRDSDSVARLMAQDGRYTLVEQGLVEGAESSTTTVIDCIDRGINTHRDPEAFMRLAADPAVRVIVSNTTEAGISFSEADAALDGPGAAVASYPGKLAWWLHARFLALPEAAPLYVLPCELIAANGTTLRSLVVRLATGWGLGDGFLAWLDSHVVFYDTLVDRIVPGKPRDDVAPLPDGSVDSFPVQAEVFHSCYLQGPRDVLDVLPLHALDLNVTFVADLTPYRDLKVWVLNGTHSTLAPVALLAGVETVSEAVDHAVLGPWLRRLVEREIVPTLALPREEIDAFVAVGQVP